MPEVEKTNYGTVWRSEWSWSTEDKCNKELKKLHISSDASMELRIKRVAKITEETKRKKIVQVKVERKDQGEENSM